MAPRSFLLDDVLQRYVLEHSATVDEVARSLIQETQALGGPSGMQVAPDQGAFLGLVTRLVGAAQAVEVGTFTGYSSLCIARNLAPGGRLLCCDVSEEWTAIGRRHWEAAGVADRIDLRIAPAAETLATLPEEPHVDLCFIDADKGGYAVYWDLLVPRVRSGGVLLIDNVLWSGRVVDDTDQSPDTVALRAFNDKVAADDRVELVVLTVADGLTFAVKR
jgi:caffeoyl-CoA O-methyltransferase